MNFYYLIYNTFKYFTGAVYYGCYIILVFEQDPSVFPPLGAILAHLHSCCPFYYLPLRL